jgi:hypothetical protein
MITKFIRQPMPPTRRIALLVLVLWSLYLTAHSYQPPRFNYQARLTDAGGAPLSGNHVIYFKLFHGGTATTPNSGANVYAESANINITAGVANHSVGSGNATSGTLTAALFAFNGDMFLQVAVDTESNIILPRQRLEPVPFAVAAKQPASFFGQFGGSGKDGDTTATGLLSESRYEFNNLVIPSGTTVTASQTHTFIGVNGACRIQGTLSAVGAGAKGGLTGTFGGGGFDATTLKVSQTIITACLSGAGGTGGTGIFSDGGPGGGAGGLGGGGSAGVPTSPIQFALAGVSTSGSGTNKQDNIYSILAYPGAGGGGGGGQPAPVVSGGGGGGVVYIECNELELTGSVTAAGQAGIPNTEGGGGGGGVVLIRARRIISKSGTVDVSGGAGASGAVMGSAGAAGFWDVVELP